MKITHTLTHIQNINQQRPHFQPTTQNKPKTKINITECQPKVSLSSLFKLSYFIFVVLSLFELGCPARDRIVASS